MKFDDAKRKRLERHAEGLSYVAEQDPHYGAEEGLVAADIRLLLAEVERLRAWIKDCGDLCNCGAFDTDQLVTRGECGDCVAAALRGEGEK